jgi:predicted Zn finger-like uncharacterized protein
MYTQCPYCQTLFRINAEQLKAASGKAHCCHCDRVFNALENLHEQDLSSDWPASRFSDPNDLQRQLPLAPARDEPQRDDLVDLLQQLEADRMIVPEIELDQDLDIRLNTELMDDESSHTDPFEPAYDLTDPDEDSFSLDTQFLEQSKLDDIFAFPSNREQPDAESTPPKPGTPLAPDSTSVDPQPEPDTQPAARAAAEEGAHTLDPAADKAWPADDEDTTEIEAAPPPFDLPGDLPDIEPAEQEARSVEQILSEKKTPGTLAWSMLIILLLLVALGQLAWSERDLLLAYPETRRLADQVCRHIKCTLPPRKAPQQIAVISRTITAHPTNPQALQVSLTLSNQADFRQPPPFLQLSLYTTEEQLVARRTFSPDEYSGSSQDLIPGQPYTIRFDLEDPGERVTGFKFDFH